MVYEPKQCTYCESEEFSVVLLAGFYRVTCHSCGATGPKALTRENAIVKYNQRPLQETVKKQSIEEGKTEVRKDLVKLHEKLCNLQEELIEEREKVWYCSSCGESMISIS